MRSYVLCLLACSCFAQNRLTVMEDVGKSNLPTQKNPGANDLIAVSVYDAPELTRTIRVEADGSIRLPLIKRDIQAAERYFRANWKTPSPTPSRTMDCWSSPSSKSPSSSTTTPSASPARSISPSRSRRKPPSTLLKALAKAEGLTESAGTEILVTRPKQDLVIRIPVKALLDASDPALNLKLEGGEDIRVPEAGRIYILGNVKKPGAFALRDGSPPSVLKLIALAEGMAPYAGKLAYIYRQPPDGVEKTEIPIEIQSILKRKSPDVPLEVNDILYIPDATGRRVAFTALEKMILFRKHRRRHSYYLSLKSGPHA